MKLNLIRIIMIVVTSSLLSGFSAQASPIKGKKMGPYQEAILMALHESSLHCVGSLGEETVTLQRVESIINSANSLEISENGSQPLFTFSYGDSTFTDLVGVTTTIDRNNILSIRVDENVYETNMVNDGVPKLTNPDIKPQTTAIPFGPVICQ